MANKVITEVKYQIPEIFEEQEVREAYLKDCGFRDTKKHIGKLCYLLNHLRVTMHLKKEKYNEDGWVSVYTKIIRELFGDLKFYKPIMSKLKLDEFVEVYKNEYGKESFKAGKVCKKYRLTPLINNMEWKQITVSVNECNTTKKLITRYQELWQPIDYELYEMLQEFHIDRIPFFELTTCKSFLYTDFAETSIFKEMAEKKVNKNQSRKRGKRKDLTVESSMQEIYSNYKEAYISIFEGGSILRYKPDEFGRRHTNITNLPKWLRAKLYVIKNGEKRRLKEVDVKNSQVLLLLTILDSKLEGYNEFKELVETGTFYEFLGEKMGMDIPLSSDDRSEIKKQFFKFVFGENKSYVWNGNICQVLKDAFPELVKAIIAYKVKHGYQAPAQDMQKAESDIIIHYVSREALKRGLLFTQIYDSIQCLPEDVDTFNALIKEGFNAIGLKATTNIDMLPPSDAYGTDTAMPHLHANTAL